MKSAAAKASWLHDDDSVDLNPLIDVITLLMVFFILAGKMSALNRVEQITVPPARTATAIPTTSQHLVLNLTRDGVDQHLSLDTHRWTLNGDGMGAWSGLRDLLNRVWELGDKHKDPTTGRLVSDVILEIRADGDASYRTVQELQQVLTDSLDPLAGMVPKTSTRPFTHILFTSRLPGESR